MNRPDVTTKILQIYRGGSSAGKSTAAEYFVGYQQALAAVRRQAKSGEVIENTAPILEQLLKLAESRVFSADKYPRLYTWDNGPDTPPTYHYELQKTAHDWCKAELEAAMKEGIGPLAVANTNMKTAYVEPFVALAQKHGYLYQIIHCEGFYTPDGQSLTNEHHTPAAIIKGQLDGFQLWNPTPPGISVEDTVNAITALGQSHSLTVCDLVGTLVTAAPGQKFINHPDHVVPMTDNIDSLSRHGLNRISIATNQCGVGNGNIKPDIYKGIVERSVAVIQALGVTVDKVVTATHRNKKTALLWVPSHDGLTEVQLPTRADKPGWGMLTHLVDNVGINSALFIGDAHHPGRSEDFDAANNFTAMGNTGRKLTYVPVQALTSYRPISTDA